VALRVGVCAALTTLALGKLAAYPASADLMWRPSWLSVGTMRLAVLSMSAVEIAYAFAVLFSLLPAPLILWCSIVLFATLSAYGYTALRHSSHCGCSGARGSTRLDKRVLLLRNSMLFGSAALAGGLGPPTLETAAQPSVMLGLAVVPYVLWAATLLWQLAQRPRRRRSLSHGLNLHSHRRMRAAFAAAVSD
jgi:hypothetical protein